MGSIVNTFVDCRPIVKISKTCFDSGECLTTNHSLGLVSKEKFSTFQEALDNCIGLQYSTMYVARQGGKLVLSFNKDKLVPVTTGFIIRQTVDGVTTYRQVVTDVDGSLLQVYTLLVV
jgi:hypothetical protein